MASFELAEHFCSEREGIGAANPSQHSQRFCVKPGGNAPVFTRSAPARVEARWAGDADAKPARTHGRSSFRRSTLVRARLLPRRVSLWWRYPCTDILYICQMVIVLAARVCVCVCVERRWAGAYLNVRRGHQELVKMWERHRASVLRAIHVARGGGT